jgi:sugar phosphate permease
MFTGVQKAQKTSIYPVFVCMLATIFYVYDYFIQVAPSIMTQQLMQSFSIGAGGLGALSACFYVSYTLMQIPAGLLLDRLGARVLIALAVLGSAIGVTLFGVTYSYAIAGLARFLIGMGAAFSFISVLFLISRWFSHRHFSIAAGMVQMGGCLGSLFGLAPLAVLVNSMGWRHSMVLIGLITFGFAFLFWIFIRDGKDPSAKPAHPTPQKARERLKFVLRKPQVWWVASAGFFSWVPVAVVGALWGVPYFMKAYGLTNMQAGRLCSLFWIGLGIGSPLMGWVSHRLQNRCVPIAACFAFGLIGSILVLDAPVVPLWAIGFALILMGFSAATQALSFGLIKDIVPPALFGMSSGVNNMAAILGGAVTQPLVGYLLHLGWGGLKVHNIPIYSIDNYRLALLLLPVAALAGLGVVLLKIKETHCQMQYPTKK